MRQSSIGHTSVGKACIGLRLVCAIPMHEMQPGPVFTRAIVAPEPVRERMTGGETKKRERVTAPMRLRQRGINKGMERVAVVVRDGEVGQIDLLQRLSGR